VVDWSALGVGAELVGPAIIEEYDSTVWVPPETRAGVLDDGSILLEL
jgi:hypothetical protein